MKVIDLQKQHKLYNKDSHSDGFGIGYKGSGKGFLNKNLEEKCIYCEDIEVETFMSLSKDDRYEFGMFSSWQFIPLSEDIRGEKIAMFIAKYYSDGHYDETRDY